MVFAYHIENFDVNDLSRKGPSRVNIH